MNYMQKRTERASLYTELEDCSWKDGFVWHYEQMTVYQKCSFRMLLCTPRISVGESLISFDIWMVHFDLVVK